MPVTRPRLLTFCLLGIWIIVFSFLFQDRLYQRIASLVQNTISSFNPKPLKPFPNVSHQERLVLHGDLAVDLSGNQWAALHQSDPENPGYYQQYLSDVSEPPSDFDQVRQQIDPENGWFLVWQAHWLAKDAIEKERTPRKKSEKSEKPQTPRYQIKDPAQLARAIDLLEEGVNLPKFDTYTLTLTKERLAILAPPQDLLNHFRSISILAAQPTPVLPFKHNAEAISAALQECQTASEYERLEKIAILLEKSTLPISAASLMGSLMQP